VLRDPPTCAKAALVKSRQRTNRVFFIVRVSIEEEARKSPAECSSGYKLLPPE
jgi:hypothetical protein